MRVGEELKPMSDEKYLKIIQEKEPDFSQQICKGVTINDLDEMAIQIMKEKYARKQENPHFVTQENKQVLIDLDLMVDGQLTNAAVILLGKNDIIKKVFPQAGVNVEYRENESNIPFDNRTKFTEPYFILIDELWKLVNLRNGSFKVQEDSYIFDIPYFNQEVIREALNNAIAHRDYRRTSEIVIKQFPKRLDIINPGGFPIGVSIDNLLTVASTPRNRLLADVLEKTGIVERSGQGVDKIFRATISEGKQEPDYTASDDYQVELKLNATIEDQAFALFIQSIQDNVKDEDKLSVMEIINLYKIKQGKTGSELDSGIVTKLQGKGLVEKQGKTKGTYYILSKDYYEFVDEKGKYSKKMNWDENRVFNIIRGHFEKFDSAKMSDFVQLFEGNLTRRQVQYLINKLVDKKFLTKEGEAKGTKYFISKSYIDSLNLFTKALNLGIQQMKDNGEIENKENNRKQEK